MITRIRAHNQTAAERREAVLDAAITEFSLKGLHGTATEDIARRAGISQPYIFRLFGTKKELFLGAANRVCERITEAFRRAAEPVLGQGADSILGAMGLAYITLLADRKELLLMLQAIAACSDEEVQRTVSRRYAELIDYVQQVSGAPQEQISKFFAQGMLLTVAAAIDLPKLLGCPDWTSFERECRDLRKRLPFHSMPLFPDADTR